MDLLSQGLLGSALASAVAKPQEIRKAGLIGLLAGLSADIDFFIRSSNDPLLNLEYHRHFTHSLFFIPIAALVLSLLLWPLFRKQLAWRRIFFFCLFGYLLSGFLDACTSYGTSLLWPLSSERFSLNIISIIDPVFTSLLLLGVVIAVKKRIAGASQVFLLLAAAYLSLGYVQHERVLDAAQQQARMNGHEPQRLLAKPTLGNLWLWRTVYQHDDWYYVNAIRINPFSTDTRHFNGDRIRMFVQDQNPLGLPEDSILLKDINRFATFSDSYLALNPDDSKTIIDVRYSNLPHSISPLWAIRIDADEPQKHASYEVYRDKSKATRQQFIDMLLGSS